MFNNRKIKKMFEDDDPKIVFYLDSKKINLVEIFKDDEDLIEKSIKNHKNEIAETAITYCENINRLNKENQSYLMLSILYDNLPMFKKLLEKDIKLDVMDTNRESALFYAINNKEQAFFNLLVEKEIDFKGYNIRGENALIHAYKQDRKELCLYMLDHHIFVNHLDKDGNTVLHYSVMNKDIDFALLLIDYGADLFIKNYAHESCLDIAYKYGIENPLITKVMAYINQLYEKDDVVKLEELLLEYEDVEDYSVFNIPFLIAVFAVKFDHKEIFKTILRNTRLLNSIDYRGKSLLMYCIEFGMFISARKIIYLDSNLNLKDKNSKTVLFTILEQLCDLNGNDGLQEDYKIIFKELLERKVDVNCQDNEGNTVLMLAISNKQTTIIKQIIAYPYTNLNIMNNDGKTALTMAYEAKELPTVYQLIQSRKADINNMDQNKNTLLLLSLIDDNLELFDLLLNYHADLDMKYKDGMTILMIALNAQKKRFIAKVFEYPTFDVNIQDDNGMTALMHAIKNENIKVVEALLKCGADIEIVDNKGDKAIFYAVEIENFEIAKLLRNYEEIRQP